MKEPAFLLDPSLLARLKKANEDLALAAKKLTVAIEELMVSMQPTQPITVIEDFKATSIDQGADGKLHMNVIAHRLTDVPSTNGYVYPKGVIRDAINRAVERGAPVTEEQPDGTRKVVGRLLNVSPDPSSDGSIIVAASIDPNSETAKKLQEGALKHISTGRDVGFWPYEGKDL